MEWFKYCLMGHTSRIMEDKGTDYDLNCDGLAQEVSEEKNINMQLMDCFVLFC